MVALLSLLVVCCLGCRSLDQMTADHAQEDALLWLDATDVAAGDTISGRVRVDAGLRVVITEVVVSGAGADQSTPGREPTWGGRLTHRLGESEGHDERAFSATIPRDVAAGTLDLEISVRQVRAVDHAFKFVDEAHETRFRVRITIHGAKASLLRRVGKAALALGSWLLLVRIIVAAHRWHGRRRREVGTIAIALGFVVALLGGYWFGTLCSHALRLHGWWFAVVCMAAWCAAFPMAWRRTVGDRRARYLVVQAMLPVEGDAYRGDVAVPRRSVDDVETWLMKRGVAVQRAPGALIVTIIGVGEATLPEPATGFGGGESFVVVTEDPAVVAALTDRLGELLGKLRWQLIEPGVLGPHSVGPVDASS